MDAFRERTCIASFAVSMVDAVCTSCCASQTLACRQCAAAASGLQAVIRMELSWQVLVQVTDKHRERGSQRVGLCEKRARTTDARSLSLSLAPCAGWFAGPLQRP